MGVFVVCSVHAMEVRPTQYPYGYGFSPGTSSRTEHEYVVVPGTSISLPNLKRPKVSISTMCNLSTRTPVTYQPSLYTPQGEGMYRLLTLTLFPGRGNVRLLTLTLPQGGGAVQATYPNPLPEKRRCSCFLPGVWIAPLRLCPLAYRRRKTCTARRSTSQEASMIASASVGWG